MNMSQNPEPPRKTNRVGQGRQSAPGKGLGAEGRTVSDGYMA
jgi:hypothetical protein